MDRRGSANPSAAIANGPGTGSGTLDINAGQIVFGHPADTLASTTPLSWSFLGFSSVNLTAGEITSNDSGTVTAYPGPGPASIRPTAPAAISTWPWAS